MRVQARGVARVVFAPGLGEAPLKSGETDSPAAGAMVISLCASPSVR